MKKKRAKRRNLLTIKQNFAMCKWVKDNSADGLSDFMRINDLVDAFNKEQGPTVGFKITRSNATRAMEGMGVKLPYDPDKPGPKGQMANAPVKAKTTPTLIDRVMELEGQVDRLVVKLEQIVEVVGDPTR